MNEARKARLLLVDDHPLFRNGLALAINGERDLEVVGEAGNGTEALQVARHTGIDLAVIDLLMPRACGITLAPELLALRRHAKIIVLSVVDEPCVIADAFTAGAHGYALKTQPIEDVIAAIRDVLGGIRYLPPTVTPEAIEREMGHRTPRPMDRMTRREREVFELLIRGHNNDEISQKLAIARRTVETHRQRITKKLSPHSIAQMQRVAARYGGLDE